MINANQVMLIDDEDAVRLSMVQTLELEGYEVSSFAAPQQALASLSGNWPGIVVSDLKMPIISGLDVVAAVQELDPDLPVVILTGHGDVPQAVRAMHQGAYDFMEKTEDPERLLGVVARGLAARRLVLENRALRRALDANSELEGTLIGHSAALQSVRKLVGDLAQTSVDVLIFGETGTGKEVVARALHDFGPRCAKPFVALNCGALATSVIESELFGHEAGAFTGATKRRIGKIEFAQGGTLFLDEIESMPPAIQVGLLRVLQERTLERLGGNQTIAVDVRVIAATKVDLIEAVAQGAFREDLLYRLQVAQLVLPPLRQRGDDALILFRHFADLAAERYGRPSPHIDAEKAGEVLSHTWPGNVRELRNAAERFVLGLDDPLANADGQATPSSQRGGTLSDQLAGFERQIIANALKAHQGRIGETAQALGVPRKTLYLRMQKYALKRDDFG